MTYHHTWLHWPQGIPKDQEARLRKLEQVRADRERVTEEEATRRIAEKVAEIQGKRGLFG